MDRSQIGRLGGKAGGAVRHQRSQEAIQAYLACPNLCLQCNRPILFKNERTLYELKKKRFCSHSCSSTYYNKALKERPRPSRCRRCSKPVEEDHIFTSVCASCSRKKPIDPSTIRKGDLRPQDINAHARSILRSREYRCTNCSYTKHVEVCHIRSIRSFPHDALLAEINHPDNLLYLCPNCHWELDAGLLHLATRTGNAPVISTLTG